MHYTEHLRNWNVISLAIQLYSFTKLIMFSSVCAYNMPLLIRFQSIAKLHDKLSDVENAETSMLGSLLITIVEEIYWSIRITWAMIYHIYTICNCRISVWTLW